MIFIAHVYYEIHDEVSKNDKVHNSFIKKKLDYITNSPKLKIVCELLQ